MAMHATRQPVVGRPVGGLTKLTAGHSRDDDVAVARRVEAGSPPSAHWPGDTLATVCLLVFAWQVEPSYPLVVAANRDERFDRPATSHCVLKAHHPRMLREILREVRLDVGDRVHWALSQEVPGALLLIPSKLLAGAGLGSVRL
jgi:hypothetical protein